MRSQPRSPKIGSVSLSPSSFSLSVCACACVFVLSLVDGSRSQCRVVGVVLQIFTDGAWSATMRQVGVGMTGPSPHLPFVSFSAVLNSPWSFRFSRPVLYLINHVWTTRAAQDLPRWTQSRAVPVTISCYVIGVVPTRESHSLPPGHDPPPPTPSSPAFK